MGDQIRSRAIVRGVIRSVAELLGHGRSCASGEWSKEDGTLSVSLRRRPAKQRREDDSKSVSPIRMLEDMGIGPLVSLNAAYIRRKRGSWSLGGFWASIL